MKLEVAGKERDVKFGIGFVRRLDEKYAVEQNGIKFSLGLQSAVPQLEFENPAILSDILHAAIKGVSQAQVDEAVENYAEENGELDSLFEEVREGLKQSQVTKGTVEKMEKATAEAEQAQKQN